MKRLTLILCLASTALARDPFTPADLWIYRTIQDPQITADGRWVAYVEAWNDRERDARCTDVRFVTADGKQRRGPTPGPNDRLPRWSPDGSHIAWVDGQEIRISVFDELEKAVSVAAGRVPQTLAWSPDAKWLAFTGTVEGDKPFAWAPPDLLRWFAQPPRPVEVFVLSAAGGTPKQLTHSSFVRRGAPAFTLDSQWIVNAAEVAPDPAHPLEGAEIYGISTATGEVRRLTEHPGPDENPLVSPDGGKIAWIAAETRPEAYAVRKLWVMGTDAKHVRPLTGSLDRDVAWPQWSSDARTVYFLADDRGSTHVYAARNDGTVRQVTNRAERLRWFSLADNGRAVSVRSNATAADELVTFAVDLPGGVIPLASPNENLLATHDIAPRDEIRFQSGGQEIQAWLVTPPRTDAAHPLPLLVEAGETPRKMCGAEFSLRARIFAARGFAVLCVNTRGTPGYGEVFGNLLRTRFPGDDFDDVMAGVDAAIAKGGIDPRRVFVAGSLTAAWALGHTDRFRAAILRRPVADWTSAVAEHFPDAVRWMGGLPWENIEQYQQHSPIYFAQNFKTPTLVVGDDTQARELYFALQSRKIDSAWLRLPRDAKPAARISELEAELAWLEHWKPE